MKAYTIAEIKAAKSFSEIEGKTQTGATDSVKYKKVQLAASETYSEAIIVSLNGEAPYIIQEPAKRSQFLHRGF